MVAIEQILDNESANHSDFDSGDYFRCRDQKMFQGDKVKDLFQALLMSKYLSQKKWKQKAKLRIGCLKMECDQIPHGNNTFSYEWRNTTEKLCCTYNGTEFRKNRIMKNRTNEHGCNEVGINANLQ